MITVVSVRMSLLDVGVYRSHSPGLVVINTINTLISDPDAEYRLGRQGPGVGGSPVFPSPTKAQYNGLTGEELGTESLPVGREVPRDSIS